MGSRSHGTPRRLRRRLAAAAVGSVAFGLVATSTSFAASTPARASGHAKLHGSLDIMGFGTNGDDVAKSRFAIAQRAVAPVKVTAPNGGFNDATFLTALASGQAPDLVYMPSADIGTYIAKGALYPFTDCIKSEKINMNVFTPGARQTVTYDNKVYGLPEFTNDTTIIANDTLLKQHGLTPQDLSTTNWKKLSEVARKLAVVKGGKTQVIGFDPKVESLFPLWVKADGGSILSSNGLKAQLNSPAAVQALQFTASLIHQQGGDNSFYSFRNTWNFFGNTNEFALNQVGGFPMQDWYYNVLASTSPNVRVTAVPFTNKKGQPIDYVTTNDWVIPAKAKNKQAACVWAKTMTETSTWMAAAENRIRLYKPKHYVFTGLFTGNHVADAKIAKLAIKTAGPGAPFLQAAIETYRVEAHSFTVPVSPASEAVTTAWQNAVQAALTGQMTPKAALDQAQSQAQSAINQAKG